MDTKSLLIMGVLVLLSWLHVVYFDRISTWRTPWDRWTKAEPQWTGHVPWVAPIALAVMVTLIFIIAIIIKLLMTIGVK